MQPFSSLHSTTVGCGEDNLWKVLVQKRGQAMESVEQELMMMLQRLPVPVMITWQNGLFHWQCAEGYGASPNLITAAEQALSFLMRGLIVDASAVVGRKWSDRED